MPSPSQIPLLAVARAATDPRHELAEGPFWDPVRGILLWVDIPEGTVYSGELDHDGLIRVGEQLTIPGTVSAVAVSADGQWLIAGTDRLLRRDAQGTLHLGEVLVDGVGRRLNDGKPDPAGRFLVGTKGPGAEQLMRVDGDEVTVLDDDLTLSNGLAWTVDGRRFYNVDTFSRRIHVRDYDPATGAVGSRGLFLELEEGFPDGIAVDADDHVWVAVWGGGCVLRVAPDGTIVGRVDVPVPQVTCATFAGDGLDVLVITTAAEDFDDAQRAQYPLSGALFTATIPGVVGAPTRLWDPRPSHPHSEGTA